MGTFEEGLAALQGEKVAFVEDDSDPNLPDTDGALGAKHYYKGMRATIKGSGKMAYPESDDPKPFRVLTFEEFPGKLRLTEETRGNLVTACGSVDGAFGKVVEFYTVKTSKGEGIRCRVVKDGDPF